MKSSLLLLFLSCLLFTGMPANAAGTVPTPESVLGFDFRDRFPEWSDVTTYMNALAASSDRVSLQYFGRTYEGRPFIQVCITSPENQSELERIRKEHLALTDVRSGRDADLGKMPLVINLMGSIHGNEISGTAALLAVAYHYASSDDPSVVELLENTVIVVTPGLNPDGINRFATWVNANSSLNHYFTPESREYSQVLPKSRCNHYWMDCNRDWLAARSDVGRCCVQMYKHWMPNVVLDMHEQGVKSKSGTFYFSPGAPQRTYKYTPGENQTLTEKISLSTARSLDSIGVKYFSKSGYDDFFMGKGAAYCDIQGSIGILHEQSSSRGHIARTENFGMIDFPQTVRCQEYAAYGMVEGAYGLKDELLSYQRDFFLNSAKASASEASKAYVFGLKDDRGLTCEFLGNLLLHGIDVYGIKGEEGRYAVPLDQKHYHVVKCIFEDIRDYSDSTFYDISTWSQSRAFGVDACLCEKMPALAGKIEEDLHPAGKVEEGVDEAAFAFYPSEYYAPAMMSALQRAGIQLKVASAPFIYKESLLKSAVGYKAGTILVPVSGQSLGRDEILEELRKSSSSYSVDVKALHGSRYFNLDSLELRDVRKPRVAILGTGTEAGQMWHLLDRRFAVEHAIINSENLTKKGFSLKDYNMVFMTGAAPSAARKDLRKWVEDGGTLFLKGDARMTASGTDFGLPPIKNTEGLKNHKAVRGVVLKAVVRDSESPLLWGYSRQDFDLMKAKAGFWTVPEGFDTVLEWSREGLLLSGCISEEDLALIAGTPVLVTRKVGKGTVIFCSVDLNYRSYWMSTSHIVSNAAFFGDILEN